jgi:hypothetical protein
MFKFHVYPAGQRNCIDHRTLDELSMLRGLAVNIVGYRRVITGLTNARFISRGRLQFAFSSANQAQRFLRTARLTSLQIRRVRPK